MGEDKLTRDDLVLLMESYRNMITMHQTILDQTNKTIDKLNIIASKLDSLFSKQGNICNTMNNIDEKINTTIIETKTNNDKIDNISINITKNLNDHEKKSIEEHSKLTNKIYIGWIGMVTIILSLIGLGITLTNIIQTNFPTVIP